MQLQTWSTLLQKIPLVRGKTRLGRWLIRGHLRQRDLIVRSRYGQQFKVLHLNESAAYQIAINGVHEPPTLAALQRLLPDDGVLVDVGANIGFFAITLGCQKPRARVLAVEASPRVVEYLRHNIALNHADNVECVHRALMDSDERTIPFYEASRAQFGMGSIAPKLWTETSETTTVTLDSALAQRGIDRVHAIKMDIEGAEAFALRGASKTLSGPDAPGIVFEFNAWAERGTPGLQVGDAQRVLLDHGYTLWRLRDWLRGGAPLSQVLLDGQLNLVACKPAARR